MPKRCATYGYQSETAFRSTACSRTTEKSATNIGPDIAGFQVSRPAPTKAPPISTANVGAICVLTVPGSRKWRPVRDFLEKARAFASSVLLLMSSTPAHQLGVHD